MYQVIPELQVLTNHVCAWKFLVVLHKVMRSGHRESIRYTPKKIAALDDIKKTWV